MTYSGSFPGSSGYDARNGQNGQWVPQQPMNGFDAFGNPQYDATQHQYGQQFHNPVFAPIYPQQQQTSNFGAIRDNQFQTYDSSFNRMPQNYMQHNGIYHSQMGQRNSVQAQHPQILHQPDVQYSQQQQQCPQQPHQHMMDSRQQQMPPPMPSQSPMMSYQVPASAPASHPQPTMYYQQQRYQPQPVPQRVHSPHVNSPVPAQSPQLPQQQPMANGNRKFGANGRIEKAARVSASPRLTTQALTRSPSVSSTRSPAITTSGLPSQPDYNSLLVCIGEEMFATARKSVLSVADSRDVKSIREYHKLIATGLGCLETVLSSSKLTPHLEARLQLRYASVLCEETTNIMEAETALTRGITVCEKFQLADLKYLMLFLRLKLLSQRGGKAFMKAIDGHIGDAELLKHTPWVYALRFFKASMYLQSANPSDIHAIENLRAISTFALQRGDQIIYIVASLLEGLSLLKNMKDDAIVRIQECIAQSQKFQLDPTTHIAQLDILALMLDFACSLHQKAPLMIIQKLQVLQARMDDSIKQESWSMTDTEILIPFKKQPSNTRVISEDTRAVITPGAEHEGCDYLAMSFWSKIEAFVMTYTYSGIGQLYQNPRNDKRVFDLWGEALTQLEKNAYKMRSHPTCLEDAIQGVEWRRELKCYLHILQGLHLAARCDWNRVKECLQQLEELVKRPLEGVVGLYTMYLAGVYNQGIGNLKTADTLFSIPELSLDNYHHLQGPARQAASGVLLLAAFNRIWIMQHSERRDDMLTNELIDRLRPLCADHPNREIRTAWNLVLSAIQTNPPIPVTVAKTHLSQVLNESKVLGDVQTLSIALNLMRAKLFQNIVGDQALKSARAGASQAKKSRNILWMSVAEGLLAQSYEVQGQRTEAQNSWETAVRYAAETINRRVIHDDERKRSNGKLG